MNGLQDKIHKEILIAYGVFAFGMFFLSFTTVLMVMKPTLYELLDISHYNVVAWLAVASIGLPLVWKDSAAYYGYAVPAALLVCVALKGLLVLHDAAGSLNRMSSFFGAKQSISEFTVIVNTIKSIDVNFGFFVVAASATWLAIKGFEKVKAAAAIEGV